MSGPLRHESRLSPGLFYWAEPVRVLGVASAWTVMGQMDGGPATEATDDWFADQGEADRFARELAGLPRYGATVLTAAGWRAWEACERPAVDPVDVLVNDRGPHQPPSLEPRTLD